MSDAPQSGPLQSFLAETDISCPSCDYNLRGLKGNACPECNQQLVLRVSLAEPRQRAFIAAVIGLAMGAGFHGLLFAYFIIRVLNGPYPRGEAFKVVCMLGLPALIGGAALFW